MKSISPSLTSYGLLKNLLESDWKSKQEISVLRLKPKRATMARHEGRS